MKVLVNMLIAALMLSFAACSDTTATGETGKLSVKITDKPFPVDWLDSAIVTIYKVEVRQKDVEEDSSAFVVISEETFEFNLLDFRNGMTGDMVEADVPVGSYDLVRLYVESGRAVFKNGMDQLKAGNQNILGVMLESFLHEGNQSIPQDLTSLTKGISVTDECMSWETTEQLIKSAFN